MPSVVRTSNIVINQIWQELVILRYIKNKNNARVATGSWIDQAMTYYLDATKINWRSSGLLYYYSFLNLAKALLVSKRVFTFKSLNTKAIHHGLRSQLQDVSNLSDYLVDILPPTNNPNNPQTHNVFSHLYQVITETQWPFKKPITISLKDIMGFCNEITLECKTLFNITRKVLYIQSLFRKINDEAWFELLVHKTQVNIMNPLIVEWGLETVKYSQLSADDRQDWLSAYHKTSDQLANMNFLRTPKISVDESNKRNIINQVWYESAQHLEPYFVPSIHTGDQYPEWQYVPNVELSGTALKWHPLLSDYLFSFALGTILRYQPQLLRTGTPNYFLAEAWCTQSSISSMKYFLMLFTSPPRLVEGY